MKTTSSNSTSNGVVISSKPSKWLSSLTKKSLKLMSLSPGSARTNKNSSSVPETLNASSSPPRISPSSNSSKGISTKFEDDFQQVFRYLDGDGDGKISNFELRAYFGSIREYLSFEEAQIVIDDLDKDGDGLLDFPEFMRLMKREDNDDIGGRGDMLTEDLKKAFEMYEVERGSGCITPKSLQRMLHRLGDEKSYDECAAMIRVFDLDDNGILDFHEFHTMMVA